jgi:hypothetical protein
MTPLPLVRRLPITLVTLLAAAVLVVACGAASSSPLPGASPAPGASGGPGPVTSAEQAAALALAQDPRFAGIGPLDPNVIGQAAWYEVSPGQVGWRVTVTKGWGDCQAGCISRHTWVYDVGADGSVTLVEETGDPLPGASDGTGDGGGSVPGTPPVPVPAEGGPWIVGRAAAGPTCPVERNPPDPACADRPVAGAVVIVRDGGGNEVARVTTGADGAFLAAVPGGGTYTVDGQPVEGVMGTPGPIEVTVADGPGAWSVVDLPYDTGIR